MSRQAVGRMDRNSPTTLYAQLADQLRQRIIEAPIPVGARLPTVRELIASYRVSLPVVRQALGLLRDEGIINMEQGRGTFVQRIPANKQVGPGLTHRLFLSVRLPSTDAFFGRILDGAERAASARNLILSFSQATAAEAVGVATRQRPAGVILAGLIPAELPRELMARGIPTVCAGAPQQPLPPTDIYWVGNDDRGGAYDAVHHLISLGHQRIGFIGGPAQDLVWKQRRAGWESALRDAGIEPDQGLSVDVTDAEFHSHVPGMRLLRLAKPPTAIFAASDALARCLYHAAKFVGMSLPRDLSIVGFDDVSEDLVPSLTSMHVDLHTLGAAACDLLDEAIAGQPPRQVILSTRLMPRASSIPCP